MAARKQGQDMPHITASKNKKCKNRGEENKVLKTFRRVEKVRDRKQRRGCHNHDRMTQPRKL
jgi:hypothetical protein